MNGNLLTRRELLEMARTGHSLGAAQIAHVVGISQRTVRNRLNVEDSKGNRVVPRAVESPARWYIAEWGPIFGVAVFAPQPHSPAYAS